MQQSAAHTHCAKSSTHEKTGASTLWDCGQIWCNRWEEFFLSLRARQSPPWMTLIWHERRHGYLQNPLHLAAGRRKEYCDYPGQLPQAMGKNICRAVTGYGRIIMWIPVELHYLSEPLGTIQICSPRKHSLLVTRHIHASVSSHDLKCLHATPTSPFPTHSPPGGVLTSMGWATMAPGSGSIKASACRARQWGWLVPDKTGLRFVRWLRQWLRAGVEESGISTACEASELLWRRLCTKETLPLPSSSAHIKPLSFLTQTKGKIKKEKPTKKQTNKKTQPTRKPS